jgi:hypothetical protein
MKKKENNLKLTFDMEQPIKTSDLNNHIKTIDLFICAASFEERCFAIPKQVSKSSKHSLIFYTENEYEEIVQNATKLQQIFGENNCESVALNTERPIINAIRINDKLNSFLNGNNIETILLDTTTFTHETLLVIYRLLEFKKDKFKNLYIAYASASGYSLDTNDSAEKWLSSGISKLRTIIGYPGVSSPARDNHLIVLFGFESDRTKSLIEELQFDTISLGFGSIGKSIDSDLQKMNCERHTSLMGYFSNANMFELSLIDPFETKLTIEKQISKYPNHNTVIAAMNTKISTIGAALVAIDNPKVQLIYAKPIEYNVLNYSTPSENCFLYKMI